MKYNKLGQTDIDVSVICLGTMTFGEQNSENEAHEQLNYALEKGVNFIDTAELYAVPANEKTQGLTEKYIGTWLASTQKREEVVLATKAAGPAPWLEYLRNGPKFTKEQLTEALHNSLERLQTDYIDLYQLHWPERQTNFFGKLGLESIEEEAWEENFLSILDVLSGFVKEGKVKHIGLSNETPWGVMKYLAESNAKDLPRVQSIQNPYSLLNRTFEVGLSEIAIREKCGLLAYSPLAFGMLSGKYLNGQKPEKGRLTLFPRMARYSSEQCFAATEQYQQIADKYGMSLAQLSLAFINQRQFVTANIIGATSMEQLIENISSVDIVLSEECLEDINEVHKNHSNPAP